MKIFWISATLEKARNVRRLLNQPLKSYRGFWKLQNPHLRIVSRKAAEPTGKRALCNSVLIQLGL